MLSKKYPTYKRKQFGTHMKGIGTIIFLKIDPLCLHTISPPILPLPKPFLEGFCWNFVQLRCRVMHYLFSFLKSGFFHCRLQFRKEPEISRIHVWRVRRLTNDWNLCFAMKFLITCDA